MVVRQLSTLRRDALPLAGGKGANLGELMAAGLPVPEGFVLTTEAYRAFVAANGLQARIDKLLESGPSSRASASIAYMFNAGTIPPAIAEAVHEAYAELGADVAVAVRSSATAEDLAEASFAGQQESVLNVRGEAMLDAAVRRCWASLWTPRAVSYRESHGFTGDLALAVVVQRMVDAASAGVMFTANPTTGRTNETVISAAWGLGEAVVSGVVTTDDLVVRRGEVKSRTTATKELSTVLTAHGVANRPTTVDQRDAAVLSDDDAIRLAALGASANAHFGVPQDLEWARDQHGEFWLVQSRPITALPEPTGPAPTQWPVPGGSDVYLRGSLIEQLPDPLSPLFADLATDLVSPGLVRTLERFLGPKASSPMKSLAFVTINGYAYYGYRNSLMLRVIPMTPLALRIAGTALGRDKWRAEFRPQYAAVVERRRDHDFSTLASSDLLAGIVELVGEGFAYYTSVQTIIPAAVTGEGVFTAFYDTLVKRPGDPRAEDFLLGFESTPLRADQSVFDLARWVRDQPALARALQERADVTADAPDGVAAELWGTFRERFEGHLREFGHATYNLDLVNPVAADDPAPVLDALRFYLGDDAASPAARRQRLAARRIAAREQIESRLTGVRLRLFRRLLDFANTMAPVREDALADVGLGWPTARAYARELGQRLVAAGVLDDPEGVYWLRRAELGESARRLDAGDEVESAADLVAERRETWRGQKLVTPPSILPLKSVWHVFDRVMPNVMETQTGPVIKGTGASGGRVTGMARIVRGPHEFAGMQPGEILVAAITTPAWTPLFALAGGVVTDIGGPLSHSSIVAREYGIPAVLGTTVATKRIATGDTIVVNGEAGTVTLVARESDAYLAEDDQEETDLENAESGQGSGRTKRGWLIGLGVLGALALILKSRRSRDAERT